MARTPLVDVFRRAAAIAAHSRRSGEPLDAVIERERELRVDHARRRFLGQSVGVSAALIVKDQIMLLVGPVQADEGGEQGSVRDNRWGDADHADWTPTR